MITINEAIKILKDNIKPLAVEKIDIRNCIGRVLAESIVSDIDIPYFNRVTMDGFAILADNYKMKKEYEIIDEVNAGDLKSEFDNENVVRINTGAVLPDNYDAVIPIEFSHITKNKVSFNIGNIYKFMNIAKKGEDCKKNDTLLKKYTELTAFSINLIASCGYNKVLVYKKPKISFFSTGNELIDINEKPEKGKIRNTNLYCIRSFLNRDKIEIKVCETLKDNIQDTKNSIDKACLNSDIVFLSGGISMGTHDHVKEYIFNNTDILFSRVCQKPGKPLTIAFKEDTIIIALPGNPLATHINYELYGRSVINLMQKKQIPFDKKLKVKSVNNYKCSDNRVNFSPAKLLYNNKNEVELLKFHTSGDMVSPTKATGICIIDKKNVEIGDVLDYIHFGDI